MSDKINIPIILEFDDYHEIEPFLDNLNLIFKRKVKAEELDDSVYYTGKYSAIFYFKKDIKYKYLIRERHKQYEEI